MTTPPPADTPPTPSASRPTGTAAFRPARPGSARCTAMRPPVPAAAPTPAPAQPTVPAVQSDAELIAASRRGDNVAFDRLITRHRAAAVRLATRLVGPNDADALVADAVGAVAAALRSGGGPVVCFRPHLLTTVRRRNHARAAAAGSVRPLDDLAPDRAVAVSGSAVDPATLPTAAAVFRRLPEDTKVALWHTEVDGESVGQAGILLGMTGTEVAELAFSARAAFRQAHLAPYLATDLPRECRWTADRMGPFAREALAQRDSDLVADHLDDCAPCRAAFMGVEAVENELRVLLAMLVLGAAAGPYLGRDSVASTRTRFALVAPGSTWVRSLVGAQTRAAAMLGIGALLAAGGLATAISLTGTEKASTQAAETRPAATEVVADDERSLDDDGPDSGTVSFGTDVVAPPKRSTAVYAPRATERAATIRAEAPKPKPTPTRPAPVRAVQPEPAEEPAPTVIAARPQAETLIADDGTLHADLGILRIDSDRDQGLIPGLLGGIELLPPPD